MSITRHIPNVFTSLNLLSGCIGIVYVTSGRLEFAAFFVWIGAFFDFLDGFSAKLLKVSSPMGKEHDSLADMVTFGVLPSVVVFKLLEGQGSDYIPYAAFLIAIFSALRLAKFNVDTNQREVFIGFPTPANALFFTGLIFTDANLVGELITQFFPLLIVTVVFSLTMVSPLRFIALKFSHLNWNGNEMKFVFLLGALTIVLLLGIHAISLVVIWYIAVSLLGNLFSKL